MNFSCPACGFKRDLPDRARGRKFLCSSCKAKIRHHSEGNRFELVEDPSSKEYVISFDTPRPGSLPPVTPDSSMGGRTVGHYRLISLIGKGGYSQVYLAEHETLHRRMAVKLLSQALASPPDQAERMAKEAESLARVDHPNVVRVYDFGNEKGTPYIAMEYVEGRSLDAAIEKSGKLSADTLIRIAGDVLAGLQTIHASGVLHRDIKPSNVLIHRDGRAALADFGLAREIPPADAPASNLFSGTADYAAPELAVGRPPNVRTDLYAVGATLYKAAAGSVPFPGESTKDKLNKQLYEPLPPLREANSDIPPALEQLIVSLLHKDPDQRPPSAKEAANRVRALREAREEAKKASGGSFWSRPRSIWEIVATAVVTAALVGSILFFALRGGEEENGVVYRTLPDKPPPHETAVSPQVTRPVPSVLHLRQGTYLAGLVGESDTSYRVFRDDRELVVRKLDVIHWYRSAKEMAALAEAALHAARELYLNSREVERKEVKAAMLTECQGRFVEARDGFIVVRGFFAGASDVWLEERADACREGITLVRQALEAATGQAAPEAPPPAPVSGTEALPEPVENPQPAPVPVPNPDPPPVIAPRPGGPAVPGRLLDSRIVSAMVWLGRHQNRDGSWSARRHPENCALPGACSPGRGHDGFDVGVTSLAILSLLGSGIGLADNDTYQGVNVGQSLRNGITYLVHRQAADGGLGPASRHKFVYNHALATYALAEARRSGRTAGDPDAALTDALGRGLTRALDFLVSAQNPGTGWRYGVRPGDNDSSVTALSFLALCAARQAQVKVPSAAFSGGLAWFDEATEHTYGRVGYNRANTGKVFIPGQNEHFSHHETLAAAAWVCRSEYSKKRVYPPLSVTQMLHNDRPRRLELSRDSYYWYYGTRYFKVVGGKDLWVDWQRSVLDALAAWQIVDGSCASGSWPATGRWSSEGGRVYNTAMNLLTLEYAILPSPFRFGAGPGGAFEPEPEPEFSWTVHLKSGGKIRVISYKEIEDGYELRIVGGTTYVAKEKVDRIVKFGE